MFCAFFCSTATNSKCSNFMESFTSQNTVAFYWRYGYEKLVLHGTIHIYLDIINKKIIQLKQPNGSWTNKNV